MPNMDGGCLCGDVRYSATGEPKVISTCQIEILLNRGLVEQLAPIDHG